VPLVAGTFLLAGLVKGVIGLGLPTVALGLLGLAMPPAEAAALLRVPSLAANAWQLLAGSGLIAGTAAHAATAAAPGGALALYGAVGLLQPRLRVPAAAEPWVNPGLVLVAVATALLDLAGAAARRWTVAHPQEAPAPVRAVVVTVAAEGCSPVLPPELRDMAGRD
jgi:hypothetical protein